MNHWWKIKIFTDNKEVISGFIITDTKDEPLKNNTNADVYHFHIKDRKSIACQPSTYTIYANKIIYIQTDYIGTEPSNVGYDCV